MFEVLEDVHFGVKSQLEASFGTAAAVGPMLLEDIGGACSGGINILKIVPYPSMNIFVGEDRLGHASVGKITRSGWFEYSISHGVLYDTFRALLV